VNTEQAKAILQHYRPSIDAEELYFREALEQVQRDPELVQWFTEHCASYEAVRRALRQTPVPAGLYDGILKAQARRRSVRWWTQPAWVAPVAAAAVIVLTVIGYALYWHRSATMQPRDFAAYLRPSLGLQQAGTRWRSRQPIMTLCVAILPPHTAQQTTP